MKAKKLRWMLAVAACCVSSAALAQQEPVPVSFQFNFCGPSNTATASGFITFDQNQLSSPFDNTGDAGAFYASAVLDLQVTVAGAGSGNGTFGRDDFNDIAWDSNGGTMDFNTELVGQPTNGWPWGAEGSSGQAGDFNLFSSGNTASAPDGAFFFVLGANGGSADSMTLRSFRPGPAAIPEPYCPSAASSSRAIPALNGWGAALLILALLGLGGIVCRRRMA